VILGAKVDGVLVVNDLNRTRRKMAQKVPDVLERGRANVLGLVLNRLPARNGYGYYYMQYYYADQSPHEKAKVPWWRRLLSRNSREDAKPAADNNETDEDARRTALRRSVAHQAPNGDAKGVE
jgi:Mrp family chromosome partitioning ATPase